MSPNKEISLPGRGVDFWRPGSPSVSYQKQGSFDMSSPKVPCYCDFRDISRFSFGSFVRPLVMMNFSIFTWFKAICRVGPRNRLVKWVIWHKQPYHHPSPCTSQPNTHVSSPRTLKRITSKIIPVHGSICFFSNFVQIYTFMLITLEKSW